MLFLQAEVTGIARDKRYDTQTFILMHRANKHLYKI